MEALLKRQPYWELLTAEERQLACQQAALRRCSAGSLLHGNCDGGGSCLGLVTVLSGTLRCFTVSREGREITLFRLRAGDSCVFSAVCVLSKIEVDTQLTAEEDAELLILPPAAYARLTASSLPLRCYSYELAVQSFSTVLRVLQEILFDRFDQRLASFLLAEYRASGSPVLHMTQEQLARSVNSAREVVARTLKQFAAAGLIETRRGAVVLKDIPGLEQLRS